MAIEFHQISGCLARVRDTANDSVERQQLFLKYMSLLCGDLKLDKSSDFLARGAGPTASLRGDPLRWDKGIQGFNPEHPCMHVAEM
jgi:hypothetical protein